MPFYCANYNDRYNPKPGTDWYQYKRNVIIPDNLKGLGHHIKLQENFTSLYASN